MVQVKGASKVIEVIAVIEGRHDAVLYITKVESNKRPAITKTAQGLLAKKEKKNQATSIVL